MKLRKRHMGILSALLCLQSGAQAQEETENSITNESQAGEDQKIEKVTITGSRIKRTDIEGPAPVQVISKDQIEASGYNTVTDVLRELPVTTFGSLRERSGRGGASGAGINLRGIGEEYTLVLVDGLRLPTDPILEYVDVNQIPVAMVERIEILKEGASALYGSDAVGGVVNIITKKNFEGTSVLYSYTGTSEKGGDEQRIEVIGGASSDKSSVVVTASYRERSVIMSADREYAAEGWSTYGNPGSFVRLVKNEEGEYEDEGPVMADPNCVDTELNQLTVVGDDTYCRFNYAKTASSAPAVNQLGLMIRFDHDFTDELKFYSFLKDTRRTTKWNYAAAPEYFEISDPTGLANLKESLGELALSVDVNQGDAIGIRYRSVELGTRDTLIQEKNSVGLMGLQGQAGDFDWDLSVSKGRSWREDKGVGGYWLISKMQELISDGKYNPFDPNRDTSLLAVAGHEPWSVEVSDMDQVNISFAGELGELGGGPIGFAVGSSYIKEAYDISADAATLNGFVAGSSASLGRGDRNYKSIYAETTLPVTTALEVGVAARTDDYSDFGQTTNPKLSVRYTLPNSMFRASVGTGFRAPSLQAIYDEGGYTYPAFIDAVACNSAKESGNAGSIAAYCAEQQYLVVTGPAEDLKPEKTLFSNIGYVFDFGKTINGSVDAWYLRINDRIGIPDHYLLTKAEQEGIDFSSTGIEITRRSNGTIASVYRPTTNLSNSEISGIDLALGSSVGNRNNLQFTWDLDTAYFIYFKEAAFEGQDMVDRIDSVGKPRWKTNNSFGFTTLQDHTLRLVARTTASTKKANADLGRIPMHNELDMQYNFTNFLSGTLSVGATNVTGKKPPVDESQNPTVDTDLYSYMGRTYYAKVTQNF